MTTPVAPDRIGPYALVRLLGRGGFGSVHEARHVETGEVVALKLLSDPTHPRLVRRFQREIKLLKSIQDAHVVGYRDGEPGAPYPYLAMELVPGSSLSEVLEGRNEAQAAYPLPEALVWATHIAQGLAAAHRLQVVHRDLKPANIIITSDGRAVVLDFGLARCEVNESTELTATGAIVGSIRYLAPEQSQGREATAASDVYQWALIVHELLFGKRPHHKLDQVLALVVRRERDVEVPPLPDPALEPLSRLIARCLRVDPAARPASATVLLEELGRFVKAGAGVPPNEDGPTSSQVTSVLWRGPTLDNLAPHLPRYRLVRLIGQGGMGSVFEAHAHGSGERVAVKVLRQALDDQARRRFRREVESLIGLSNRHVVRLLEFGDAGPWPYLVMEFLEGEDLAASIRKGTIPPRRAIAITTDVLDGLAAMHAMKLVHRDLKPGNIELTRHGDARLLDLGLARGAESGGGLTATGEVAGTLSYMPPEVLRGEPHSTSGDVFQVAAVLYEMVTGRRDFRSGDAPEILRGFLSRAEPGEEAGQLLVDEAVSVFRKSISSLPSERPPDAGAMLAAVKCLVVKRPSARRAAAAPVVAPPVTSPPRRAVNAAKLVFAIALVAFALAVAVLVPQLMHRVGL